MLRTTASDYFYDIRKLAWNATVGGCFVPEDVITGDSCRYAFGVREMWPPLR